MATRQELIRTTFKKGATFASGGITVLITETPEITPGEVDGSFYSSLVKIRFNAQVGQMKLYRQDGSEVELNEKDAQKWLKMGLATVDNPKVPKPKPAPKQEAK